MPAVPTTNLYITMGSDFATDVDLDIDINGFTVEAAMKRSFFTDAKIDFVVTITDYATGKITLSLPNSVTKELFPTRYVYTVMVRSLGELYYPVLEGIVVVNPSTVNV